MKVALIHDWLIHMRGGEKVLDALAELYPDATIYTLFSDRKQLSPRLRKMKIVNSFFHYLPGIKHYYRWLLPLLPFAIRSLNARGAELVISSSHCVAKGIRIQKHARHICYCHTPMRYLWEFRDVYFDRYPALIRGLIGFFLNQLKRFDLKTNERVDLFIANSQYIRERIMRVYRRDAVVVHPPCELDFFSPGENNILSPVILSLMPSCEGKNQDEESSKEILPTDLAFARNHGGQDDKAIAPQADGSREPFYLAVSHFVPYKRLDIVIKAFNELDRPLVIIGSGPLETQYRQLARKPRISFLGSASDADLRETYQKAKALIFPAEEDFGIVPLEAQACGTPVVAFGCGGALETVKSGVFFDEQTPEAVKEAVLKFETMHFNQKDVASRVQAFGRQAFLVSIRQLTVA